MGNNPRAESENSEIFAESAGLKNTSPHRVQSGIGVAAALVIALTGTVILQVLLPTVGSKNKQPGPGRGDMVLAQDDLPQSIGNWMQSTFEPPPDPSKLPKGQSWWVHSWSYVNRDSAAIVSCDQLGEDHWHELTLCYRSRGWKVLNRTEYPGTNSTGGPFVVADMKNDHGDSALLVFSVFFEDGTWAAPPTVDLTHLNRKQRSPGLFDKARERMDPIVTFGDSTGRHTRAIQCQVLVANARRDVTSELDAAIELHLESRENFRSSWLAHRSSQIGHSGKTAH